ncbi:FadR/GntR family transcriptional regulator [Pelagibacterium xiamenense]|uniref:FadR/GntR family transcriptional regulator n=1 Tax=Pelagibacterium xiamenense TaxID=2901140 RepID=UPI001E63B569|nr:FCD domain-containing protein [Pelagibacterium xiamenense]MCD7059812.1 FCD domain-containing protein [Pelagibacterium xiamenense]
MSPSRPPLPVHPTAPPIRRKRTDEIVDAIKTTIIEHGLQPGDRLPQERELMEQYQASKGTIREALKALEVQGLIRTRTGPGGGAFIESMSESRAMSLLSNFLFAKSMSIADIYALRKVLEPLVAVSAMPNMDAAGYKRLTDIIAIYDHEPADAQERWDQRMAELDFHAVVAEYADNALMAFVCRFLQRLLKELAVCRDIYMQPKPVLRQQGIEYQRQLIEAMRAGDGARVHKVMTDHMVYAEHAMLDLQAELLGNFIHDPVARGRGEKRRKALS